MATRVQASIGSSAQLVRRRVDGARASWRGVDPRALPGDAKRALFPDHLSTGEWLWRALWAPWWLGSDMPAPALPAALPAIPAAGPAGDHVARHLRRLVRRLWIQRALQLLMRSVWLGVAVGCGWVVLELLGGPALSVPALVGLTLVLIVLGGVLAACSRPSYAKVARMLDASFALQDRMRTAVEHFGRGVPEEGERASVVYLQMADAANVMTAVHRYPAFRPGLPVREVVLGIAAGLLLGALYLVRGASGDLPDVAMAPVPGFVPAKERLAAPAEPVSRTEASLAEAPTAQDVQAKAEQSNATRADLNALAAALEDHPTTRAAAEAIRQGDYATASRELSEAAANADQLSPAEREGLADDLDAASAAMSGENPALQGATSDAADGLRQGGEPAKQGVEDLSAQVAETGASIESQEQLASEMRQAQAADQQRASQGGDQRAQGSDAPSNTGDPQSGDPQSGDPQSGDSQQGGSQGAPSSSGDPSAGADAAPGEGQPASDQPPGDQSQGQPSNQDPGAGDRPRGGDQQGSQPSDQSQGQAGDSQQPGSGGSQANGDSQSQASQGTGDGTQPGAQGGSQSENAQNGSGAGSGQGAEQPAASTGGGQPTQPQDANGDGVPDPNVTDATASGAGQPDAPTDPRDAITLSRSPDAAGYQTSGDAGSSSLGSGSGATAGTGETSQGEVGEAGPDANRVPEDYRGIVEDYFTDP